MIKRGFTLIEVLTVITIIGLLVSLGSYTWTSVARRSRNSARRADIERLRDVLQQYYTDKRSYPQGEDETSPVAHCALSVNLKNYLDPIPRDPKNKNQVCNRDLGTNENKWANSYIYFPERSQLSDLTSKNVPFPRKFALGATIENDEQYVGYIFETTQGWQFGREKQQEPQKYFNFTYIVKGQNGR